MSRSSADRAESPPFALEASTSTANAPVSLPLAEFVIQMPAPVAHAGMPAAPPLESAAPLGCTAQTLPPSMSSIVGDLPIVDATARVESSPLVLSVDGPLPLATSSAQHAGGATASSFKRLRDNFDNDSCPDAARAAKRRRLAENNVPPDSAGDDRPFDPPRPPASIPILPSIAASLPSAVPLYSDEPPVAREVPPESPADGTLLSSVSSSCPAFAPPLRLQLDSAGGTLASSSDPVAPPLLVQPSDSAALRLHASTQPVAVVSNRPDGEPRPMKDAGDVRDVRAVGHAEDVRGVRDAGDVREVGEVRDVSTLGNRVLLAGVDFWPGAAIEDRMVLHLWARARDSEEKLAVALGRIDTLSRISELERQVAAETATRNAGERYRDAWQQAQKLLKTNLQGQLDEELALTRDRYERQLASRLKMQETESKARLTELLEDTRADHKAALERAAAIEQSLRQRLHTANQEAVSARAECLQWRPNCAKCLARPSTFIVVPCGHFVSCEPCSRLVSKCPECQIAAERTMRVVFPSTPLRLSLPSKATSSPADAPTRQPAPAPHCRQSESPATADDHAFEFHTRPLFSL